MKLSFLTLDITLVGGVERVLSNLLPVLSKEHDNYITIYSFYKKHASPSFTFPGIRIVYLTDRTFQLNGLKNKVISYFFLLKGVFKLNYKSSDFVVSTFPSISILCLLFKNSSNLVLAEHSQFDAHNALVNKIRISLYRKAKLITVLTEEQKKLFATINRNVIVIPNPIIYPAKQAQSNSDIILAVGRLVPEKGFDSFLRMLSKLKVINSNWHAKIVGTGPDKGLLIEIRDSLGLSDKVDFFENITELESFYITSKLMVATSLTESFGMAILEGMSYGLPVVAYDSGVGPRTLIEDGVNGCLVKETNEKEMADKVNELLLSHTKWSLFSQNAKESSLKFDVHEICKSWMSIFI